MEKRRWSRQPGNAHGVRAEKAAVASVGCFPPCHFIFLHLKCHVFHCPSVATRHLPESCPQGASKSKKKWKEGGGQPVRPAPALPVPARPCLSCYLSPVQVPIHVRAIPSAFSFRVLCFFSCHQSSSHFPPVPSLPYIIMHPFSNTVPPASTSCQQCRHACCKSSLAVVREAE